MALIFTFLLVAGLEIASANDKPKDDTHKKEVPQEPDMCVGCDDKKEEKKSKPQQEQQLKIEIIIDPVTGNVQYVIDGISLE